ncbi:class I SAM-dependent methyltransferase [Pseudovibrio sp. Tun.PSC04-5.I4]|uniref:class I SAM-dependent methyltransferase n=1 Tax=Pseudovibrio sp. Tun.PSC04-5.I4 TaxID=1798213 RepID=UPI0008806CD7|nr:class I SAM-dependent methyltransferase [Pseudovibrio sp. Tun.PSC04-5.I4]SDQ71278.1 Methyltransferase domain-containing protein [Pseudovibrio sp. Tun.PSC04-5.I4]
MNRNILAASHFQSAGEAYAKFRPTYPPELAEYLAAQCSQKNLALEVGCGTGQFTGLLAHRFAKIIATDVSASQIESAKPIENVRFLVEPAEQISVESGSVNLIVAAQAAHWFNLPEFYQEVRRIAHPDCVLALVNYGVLAIEDDVCNARFRQFYYDEIGPYWPPERQHVDNGYASFDFPFAELQQPELAIERNWNLEQFLGYIRTWSLVKTATKAGKSSLMENFAEELTALWNEPDKCRKITWPITMRIGRVRP